MIEEKDLRNRLFFSLENLYAIFEIRDKSKGIITNNSKDYKLIYLDKHNNQLVKDVIKKLSFIQKTGMISLNLNCIVSIKINGQILSYRYMGSKTDNPEEFIENFIEVKNFTDRESREEINEIHEKNKVIGAVDGRIYHIEELKDQELYALDYEVFRKGKEAYNSTLNYALYRLDSNGNLKNMQPDSKSFTLLQNALYYFHKAKQKHPAAILLLNRKELELVNDYNILNGIMA